MDMNIRHKRFGCGAAQKILISLCCVLAIGLFVAASSPAQAQQQLPQAIQDQLNGATAANIAQIAADLVKANPELAAAIAAAAAKLHSDAAADIAVAVANAVPDKAAEIAQEVVNEVPESVDSVNTAMADIIPNWTQVTATQPTSTTATDTTATSSTSSTTSTTETTTTKASPSSELLNRLASARGL